MEQNYKTLFPFWENLTEKQQTAISESLIWRKLQKGTVLFYGGGECTGLEILLSGKARVFITSPNGGEITLYRLSPNDTCILSASCMIQNIDFEVSMEFEEDSELYIIPQKVYKELAAENQAVKDTNMELVANRFSDVMWVMNQLVFSNTGKRLADALLEQYESGGQNVLHVTHDKLAKDLGTAREVVSRLLKQFELDGIIRLSRGSVELLDMQKLRQV